MQIHHVGLQNPYPVEIEGQCGLSPKLFQMVNAGTRVDKVIVQGLPCEFFGPNGVLQSLLLLKTVLVLGDYQMMTRQNLCGESNENSGNKQHCDQRDP